MRLTDAVSSIFSLFKICAAPIRFSKHNVTCRREGNSLACCLDVANKELAVRIILEFLGSSVTIP